MRGAESLLAQCSATFERAEEIENVIRTQRLLLARTLANAPARSDAVRYNLGYALERAGQFDEALRLYGEVQATNLLKTVQQRVSAAEAKRDQQKMAKK